MRTLAAVAGVAAGYAVARSRRRREERRTVLSKSLGPLLANELHGAKVRRVSQQLREHRSGRPVSLRKKSVAHQVPKAGDLRRHDEKIDIGDLNAILHLDPIRQIC